MGCLRCLLGNNGNAFNKPDSLKILPKECNQNENWKFIVSVFVYCFPPLWAPVPYRGSEGHVVPRAFGLMYQIHFDHSQALFHPSPRCPRPLAMRPRDCPSSCTNPEEAVATRGRCACSALPRCKMIKHVLIHLLGISDLFQLL